ncbi:hypothetical protein ABZ835_36225 [Streptomyces sp. NPDC047461]|uniref:hypothetical protein n=1 Tax=Streptomyces sp. NPDC047461 TaxID=3155619 RepID=UPI0033E60B1D
MIPDATSHSASEPEVQCFMFQATTGPLVSMALLSLELDEVARRLSLTIEESWDGHGAVRAAFFTLAGTDFVVTRHEGDPPGTYVWVRKSGPVDPAARTGILLTALGVGTEVVSYSTWGIGTDLSHIPGAWRRFRHRPVDSHQRFWESLRDHMGMYLGRITYEASSSPCWRSSSSTSRTPPAHHHGPPDTRTAQARPAGSIRTVCGRPAEYI